VRAGRDNGRMAHRTETDAITATVLDYFEGWFEGDAERMGRALHRDLVKRRSGEELGVTTKQRMLELTEQGEGREDAADGRIDIVVDDVYKDIASVTVSSATYHEYVHLVRTQDGWRIANTLWQLT
jgi:ketosteroid isomerase-like protein